MFSAHNVPVPASIEIENYASDRYFEEASEICLSICHSVSKANYVALAVNQLLSPEILLLVQDAFGVNTQVSQPAAMSVICSIIAGSAQTISGIFQMKMALQGDVYNPIETGVKGMMNIGSGALLIGFTATLPLALNPIGLAVASGVTSGMLWSDFIHSVKKATNKNFWFKDSIDQLTFIKENLTREQDERQKRLAILKDVDEASSTLSVSDHPAFDNKTTDLLGDFIFYHAANRIENNIKHAKKLENEIFARLLVDYKYNGGQSYLMTKMYGDDFDIFSVQQKACLQGIKKTYNPGIHYGKHEVAREVQINTEYAKAFNMTPSNIKFNKLEEIAEKSRKAAWIHEARPKLYDAIMMTMAFVGFLCLAIPGAQIFSPIFLVSSSAYFIGTKLCPAGQSVWNSIQQFYNHQQKGVNQVERYATFAKLFPTPLKKPIADEVGNRSQSFVAKQGT